MCTLHTYTCHPSHIFVEESSSVQYSTYCMINKEHKNTMHSHLLGIVSQLNKFHIIPSQIFTTYDSQSIVLAIHFTSSKGTNNNMIFLFL